MWLPVKGICFIMNFLHLDSIFLWLQVFPGYDKIWWLLQKLILTFHRCYSISELLVRKSFIWKKDIEICCRCWYWDNCYWFGTCCLMFRVCFGLYSMPFYLKRIVSLIIWQYWFIGISVFCFHADSHGRSMQSCWPTQLIHTEKRKSN